MKQTSFSSAEYAGQKRKTRREFVGVDLSREDVPDATTLLEFRRLLEQQDLAAAILAEVNAPLSERGLLMRQGTVVDPTIIAAPTSTKNEQSTRDPEMRQAKKGEQWHFGMKVHHGVDAQSGIIHSVLCTAANEAAVVHALELMHGHRPRATRCRSGSSWQR